MPLQIYELPLLVPLFPMPSNLFFMVVLTGKNSSGVEEIDICSSRRLISLSAS